MMNQIFGQSAGKGEGDAAQEGGALPHVLGLLHGKCGGLGGLVEAFRSKGLGDIVHSWVGNGANLPVTSEQLDQVFEKTHLQELAAKVGVSPEEFKAKVAQLLPSVVDKLTPNGRVPDNGGLENPSGTMPQKG